MVGTFYLGSLWTIFPRIHFAIAQVAGARYSIKNNSQNALVDPAK